MVRKIEYIQDNLNLEKNPDISKIIGGKSLGLHQLKNTNLIIPKWITISNLIFNKEILENITIKNLIKKNIPNNEKAKSIQNSIQKIKLNDKILKNFNLIWKRLSKTGKIPLAVRSSALDEDNTELSFAGQMDSFLNIRTEQNFYKSIIKCWASIFNIHAVTYRIKNNINPWKVSMAVLIQQMINSDISGVIFNVNTITGNLNETMICSVWGLGEGLVSGKQNSDTFILNNKGIIKKKEIAKKSKKIIYDSNGGTKQIKIDKNKTLDETLNKKQLLKLFKSSKKIKKYFGKPMDIEFAIQKNKLYFLQARPITNLSKLKNNNLLVWDNSNIVESYSGVTTPLTFTFIKKAYSGVYRQFCEIMGVDKKIINENINLYQNMLGLIFGRVYYNLINWYKLVALLPGFKYNKEFMEQMMGLQVIKDYVTVEEETGFLKKYFIYLPRTLRVVLKMIYILLTLKKRINIFFKNFYTTYNKLKVMDFNKFSPYELMNITYLLEKEILNKWKEPILNDLKGMIFYGVLKKLTQKWKLDNSGSLQNELLTGEGGIKSKMVVTELFKLAKEIEKDDKIKKTFLNEKPEAVLKKINSYNDFIHIKILFEKYINDYGVRSIEEMKLESVPIKDNPLFCINIIKNYLSTSVPHPDEQYKKELEIRKNAEEKLKKRLKFKTSFIIIPKISIYKCVLKHTREAIKDRENQRFCRSEIYSITRDIIKAVGKNWGRRKLIDDKDDIFYLEWDEIWSYVRGTSTTVDLKGLIHLRKKEFDGYKKINPPDHIETANEVYPELKKILRENIKTDNLKILKGIGACAGIVKKKVIVLTKPDLNTKLNGEILIAKQTDPGWVVLFPAISGLIVEKGSMLSHSAIVAREMGIPAIIGVQNATNILKTNDIIKMDGTKGTIKIIKGK